MTAPITSLLYVSNSLLSPPAAQSEVEQIVSVALERNAACAVTGALIFTGAHFAQVLEGDPKAIDDLMASILADTRHKDVQVVEVREIKERRFPGWSMAYSGPSTYVEKHIRPLLDEVATPGAHAPVADALVRLMIEFAGA